MSGDGIPLLKCPQNYVAIQYLTCERQRKVKIKVHALDIAPLRSESPSQKRSGMARVLKGFQFYLHTHTFNPQSEWAIPAVAFPAAAGTHLPTPERWKAEQTLMLMMTIVLGHHMTLGEAAALSDSRYSDDRYSDISKWVMQWVFPLGALVAVW